MTRCLAAILLILTVSLASFPQGFSESRRQIIALSEKGETAAAITELKRLSTEDAKAFEDTDLDYLLGRLAERSGQTALATTMYRRVSARRSHLRPYALMHLAGLMRGSGNAFLERIYLTDLITTSPEVVPASGARHRLAAIATDTGNYAEAVRYLTGGTSPSPSPSPSREDQVLLAEAYTRSGQPLLARPLLTSLLNTMPVANAPEDAAMIAARMLDSLDGTAGLSVAEHLKRANIFQFNREFKDAQLHFEAVIAAEPDGTNAADSAFQIGRGYAQTYDFVEALKWFERVLEQYQTAPIARDALLQAAAAYARLGKAKEAKSRYQLFIDRYPDDEKLDRAYLNLVDVSRDLGLDQEALKAAAKAEDVFRGKPAEATAVFVEARIYIARTEWTAALDTLDRLSKFNDLGASLPGGTSPAEVNFLRAYCLEQIGRYGDAIDAYLVIPDGRGEYYGWRATERLHSLEKNDASSPFIAQTLGRLSATLTESKDADERRRTALSILRVTSQPEQRSKALETLRAAIRSLPKYALPAVAQASDQLSDGGSVIGHTLLSLGLFDEAAPELELGGVPGTSPTLSEYYRRGGRVDRSVGAAESLWKKVPADFPVELISHDQLKMLYPAPFRDELIRFAKPRGVDPRFLLAIMRQESRFRPDAKSNAAARGLMQFIATTSNKIAKRLDRVAFEQDDLFYPPTAILFGTQYLSDLNALFPNEPDAVAASYNGGEENVQRWLARSRVNIPERYMPEIVYAQSKDYAARVMANYRMYQLIYDENLLPISDER